MPVRHCRGPRAFGRLIYRCIIRARPFGLKAVIGVSRARANSVTRPNQTVTRPNQTVTDI